MDKSIVSAYMKLMLSCSNDTYPPTGVRSIAQPEPGEQIFPFLVGHGLCARILRGFLQRP